MHMQVKAIPEVWLHPEHAEHSYAAARKTVDTQKDDWTPRRGPHETVSVPTTGAATCSTQCDLRSTVSRWKPQPRVYPTKLVRAAPGSHFPQFPRLCIYSHLVVCASLNTQHQLRSAAARSAGRRRPCREPTAMLSRLRIRQGSSSKPQPADDGSSGRRGSATDIRHSLAGNVRSSCECAYAAVPQSSATAVSASRLFRHAS